MPKNLELKVRITSVKMAVAIARRIGACRAGSFNQTDTYFGARADRLKLREIDGKQFELIHYNRTDRRGGRYSEYIVVPLQAPGSLKRICRRLFEQTGIVRKTRIVYIFKNARIHIDSLQRLGSFLEFEVLVTKGKRQARHLFNLLVEEFSVDLRATIAGSYIDLLQNNSSRRRARKNSLSTA